MSIRKKAAVIAAVAVLVIIGVILTLPKKEASVSGTADQGSYRYYTHSEDSSEEVIYFYGEQE